MTHTQQDGAFHRLTILPMMSALANLDALLDKAQAHAATARIDPVTLLNARLYPDMFSLIQQLQYALFLPVHFAQAFTEKPAPKIGYEEASFAEVRDGIGQASAYLRSVPPGRLDDQARVVLPIFFDEARGLAAEDYAAQVIMPDFYFHLTIAYAILRHNGVPVGKSDFLGKLKTVAIG